MAEAKEDHRESELYRSETMRLYETILREYPSYERKDEVLFSLGYNLYEIGKKDQAVKRYEELIKHYPGSKFVADTYVQLGNHYFDVANVLARQRDVREGVRVEQPEASSRTRCTSWPGVTSTPASTRRRSRSCRTPSSLPRSRASR